MAVAVDSHAFRFREISRRITRFAETGDDRYLITLTGVGRFRIVEELTGAAPYRRFRVDYSGFGADLLPGAGENAVDRESMISMLRTFAESSKLEVDWASIDAAPAAPTTLRNSRRF